MPHTSQAADMYQQVPEVPVLVSSLGIDPVSTEEDKMSAEPCFADEYPDILVLLDNMVNYSFAPFQDALLIHLINIMQQLNMKKPNKDKLFLYILYILLLFFNWN